MTEFTLDGQIFKAKRLIDGVLVDPELPPRFDNTPHDRRPRIDADCQRSLGAGMANRRAL